MQEAKNLIKRKEAKTKPGNEQNHDDRPQQTQSSQHNEKQKRVLQSYKKIFFASFCIVFSNFMKKESNRFPNPLRSYNRFIFFLLL